MSTTKDLTVQLAEARALLAEIEYAATPGTGFTVPVRLMARVQAHLAAHGHGADAGVESL